MKVSPDEFRAILCSLVEDNPLACRGMLRICEVEFDHRIPTLQVTLTDPSRLKVNLEFIEQHCHNEHHIRAVILHEFLHVLLQHTCRFKIMTPLLNLALDAVINSTIHRTVGPACSDMMTRFYAAENGLGRLLRPPTDQEAWVGYFKEPNAAFKGIWSALYRHGNYQTDEIIDFCRELAEKELGEQIPGGIIYIGNHDPSGEDCDGGVSENSLDPILQRAIVDALKALRHQKGFCRNPDAHAGELEVRAKKHSISEKWKNTVIQALRDILDPAGRTSHSIPRERESRLPILTPQDRRACLRQLWSPFLVDASWNSQQRHGGGETQVYLDVSGSISGEIRELVALLAHFRGCIREPLWAFSDTVVPARLAEGRLQTGTTGGTDIDSVLAHLNGTKPRHALIITDGIVGQPNPGLHSLCTAKIHAIISPNGNARHLREAGIPCFQLDKLP